ncbi:MAG: Metallo-beta-lactamase family protein [Candidatus Nomurabacteria bacterium GW2011_GWA1_46_11]|uniref:Ribonuclease J n=1 Tax=Candidatus Nomurabacteria bacterium GW2011_GWA1_46_11 TaxID=1618732 RepID=A0A0G1RMZ1_9BACT|nr:MAG: Metallo-beta-lactamase family protein [Parcubacteria group bacterium GW2011_GWA2_46_10]KKU22290.1 MAG: Metallo-beta-lactamase family protein [Candidatus Nomurabacteria bacterium GW2011_GWA1_46_11]
MPTTTKRPIRRIPPRRASSFRPASHKAIPKRTVSKEEAGALRFVPLGGLEEIGRNMSYLEYGDEIVIVDMGFQFPEEDTPGIDYIIPNVTSLMPKKENIKAVVITHGHMDHIGAIPYLLGKLGNPPIYTLRLTKALIEKRQQEFPNEPKPNIIEVKYGDKKKVGQYFDFTFFGVEHTIPDSMGVVVGTPIGNIVNFGDFRLDRDENGNIYRMDEIEKVAKMGVHTYLMDSTDAIKEGIGISEKTVEKNIEEIIRKAKKRIILTTFSSMITRIAEIVKIAEKMGKKVAINGRSMKENMEIAKNLGLLKYKEGTMISPQEVNSHKDENVLIITTGAQGEPNSGFMRIVDGSHKHIQLKKTDTVIFSSSVVPGNERSVQSLTDNIARQVDVVQNYKLLDIHAGGHAPQEDLKLVIKTMKPKYLVPIHAYYHFRTVARQLAEDVGMKRDNVKLIDNGDVCLLTKDGFEVSKEKVDTGYVMVDGLGVGDVEEVVLRDRRMLADDGMVVLIVTIDRRSGRVMKNPDIISRGFIYLREHQELLKEIRHRIRGIVGRIPRSKNVDADYLKSLFRDQIGQFIYHKTQRRPMILPVVIEI